MFGSSKGTSRGGWSRHRTPCISEGDVTMRCILVLLLVVLFAVSPTLA